MAEFLLLPLVVIRLSLTRPVKLVGSFFKVPFDPSVCVRLCDVPIDFSHQPSVHSRG
jgi:hypothetical protein